MYFDQEKEKRERGKFEAIQMAIWGGGYSSLFAAGHIRRLFLLICGRSSW
jgi:hypothetical protein